MVAAAMRLPVLVTAVTAGRPQLAPASGVCWSRLFSVVPQVYTELTEAARVGELPARHCPLGSQDPWGHACLTVGPGWAGCLLDMLFGLGWQARASLVGTQQGRWIRDQTGPRPFPSAGRGWHRGGGQRGSLGAGVGVLRLAFCAGGRCELG